MPASRGVLATFGLGLLIAAGVSAGEPPEEGEPAPSDPAAHVRTVSPEEVALEEAERWISEHPKEPRRAIRRLKALLETVCGTGLEERVESHIRRLSAVVEKASARKAPKQRETEALQAFAQVKRLIRTIPDSDSAHEDNIALLTAALQIAEGTSVEDAVLQELERENERDRGGPLEQQKPKGGSDSFAPGLGLRVGFGDYLYTTDHPLYPRTCLGLYYHFAGRKDRRLEGGLDYLPSRTAPGENRYLALRLSSVRYAGDSGLFYYAVGGGAILEEVYGRNAAFGFLDVAVGSQVGSSRRRLNLRFSGQVPVGPDLNVPWLLLFSVGYDL